MTSFLESRLIAEMKRRVPSLVATLLNSNPIEKYYLTIISEEKV